MMLVPDVTLQQSHTDKSLEVLGERMMPVCIYLLTFRLTIYTSRNEEWVEDEDELAIPTTYVQWEVIQQILGMVAWVVDVLETLSTFNITINSKDSWVYVPRITLSPYVSGSNDIVVDPNMLE